MLDYLTATGKRVSMGSHSVTCHPTEANIPRHKPPAEAVTRFRDPRKDERLSWPEHSFLPACFDNYASTASVASYANLVYIFVSMAEREAHRSQRTPYLHTILHLE